MLHEPKQTHVVKHSQINVFAAAPLTWNTSEKFERTVGSAHVRLCNYVLKLILECVRRPTQASKPHAKTLQVVRLR